MLLTHVMSNHIKNAIVDERRGCWHQRSIKKLLFCRLCSRYYLYSDSGRLPHMAVLINSGRVSHIFFRVDLAAGLCV